MIVGGIQWMTLLDYPDKIAATLFTAGCNFRCSFCHNPELVLPELVAEAGTALEESFFDELADRRGFLDAIVISGGEPTLQSDLLDVLARIKEIGYLVKLDTNGARPEIIEEAFDRGLLDFIAMDIKSPADRYEQIVGISIDTNLIQESISLIQQSGKRYEFRTTAAPGLSEDDLFRMGCWLEGSKAYWLQMFRAPSQKRLVDESCREIETLGKGDLEAVWERLRDRFEVGGVRG
ncbi:anaerobic ribonucleoside-triphosphate reductase activating protein [Candidatus Bipolaricaulota bacterium]|nr:anaerobic ribonucleoside-triphosphate reductase activating protein [Candidatus Bipolaricaulota bacterium]